ncbi:MAG: hypothetical protein MHMPM18_005174 [Marteilia pararefringens]
MDNQSTSSRNESQGQETKEKIIEHYVTVNSCCLITSFLSYGMSISFAVVNIHKKNNFDAFYTTPLILSLLMIALQFFVSLLFVWCRLRLNRTFGGVIAVFTILIQIAILVLTCKYSQKSVFAASVVNLLLVFFWSGSFYIFSSDYDKYINQTGINRDSFKIPYLNILVFSLIVWKQALIGFLSIMLQLQNPFSSGLSNILYFSSIIMHLLCDIFLISKLAILRSLYWFNFIHKVSIFIDLLNLSSFIGFIIFSYVGRSKLSFLQITIWLILIATFFLEFILTIWIVIKAIRKHVNPTSNDIELMLPDNSEDPNQTSDPRFLTTSV